VVLLIGFRRHFFELPPYQWKLKWRVREGREGKLGEGKSEDLPIMTDGVAKTPFGSISTRPGRGLFFFKEG
jgi:hypothetical protein